MLALALVLAIQPAPPRAASAQNQPVLEVPWPCGNSYPCTQGNGGQASHTGLAQYAWDFAMPSGSDIVAVHGGTVLMLEMDSQVGGCSDVYANDANYVLIDHRDGTAGLYLHVEGNSSSLRVGDAVAAGDVIARVGQTGWTCGPHLHFQVQEICGSWWCQSVPAELGRENCGPSQTIVPEARLGALGPRDEAGCACSSRSDPRGPLFGLLALIGLGHAHRRRR
jgi:MYXO-CTERM domain-containing protein